MHETATMHPSGVVRMTAASALLLAALSVAPGLQAQGLDDPEAIEKIIGSEVQEEEVEAAADTGRVIRAIEATGNNISTVRKTTMLDKVDIVFLTDSAVTEGGPPPEVEAKLQEHKDEITQLRQELEGNAMLYHAIDSRQILLRDILAIEFHDRDVVIYAAAKPAG
ncbi:hypothetical protein [Mesorhizobium xinjiangense]|uniref:hypothetical protein n=1 Tax=Mesorhizobium xinjiangense TaxID=2678685 RepID=UPI001F3D833F|nr:hypothetical protein [Mesorhizobium xinjiangense]